MALPPECVGPVCDAFLQRAEKLLSAPERGSCSISNVKYCVLTIKLLAEENEHALLHVTSILFDQQNRFMRAAFKFMLCDVPSQEGRPKVVEMLCDLIATVFKWSSAQKIVFENEVAVRGILASLQSLLAGDMLKKVQPPILNLMVTALYKFSSKWPSQPKDTQHVALHILTKLLQQIPAHPATRVLVKAIQIQLLTLFQQPLSDAVVINMEEADFLLSALSSAFPILSANELVSLLKCLTVCEQNRLMLMERGILDSLAALVNDDDDDDGQESAAQLICALMDAVSICHEDQMGAKALEKEDVCNCSTCPCDDTLLQVCDDGGLSDEVCSMAVENQPDSGAMDLIKCLLPCILTCFENFIAACTNKSNSVASLQVFYASTLLRLMLEVFSQEDEHAQTAIADSLATSPGVPDTFLTMLRTSTVVRCHIDSAPLPWVSTFINIQNCFLQWTNCSEQFCQALCSIGLVHFMETELNKLSTMPMSNVDGSESALGAPSRPVLAILYNCIQKQNCLPSFLRATDLHTSLEVFTMSQNLETRWLSKLILGFLLPTLTTQQQSLLRLTPDEVIYLLSTLNDASQSPDLSADGYSATELLQGLLHFLEVEENVYICVDSILLKILKFFLMSSEQGLQKLVLHIVWNILTDTHDAHTKETFLSLPDIVPVIKTLRVSSELELLYTCVLMRTQQSESLECGTLDLLAYARGCFQYQKYSECSLVADQILQENKLEQSIANEAHLLKGKSLYFVYKKRQHMFLKTQSSQPIKKVETLKKECYEKAKATILHLGIAQDHGSLDTEGSRYLDYAMIDYLRETNNLGNCQRCLLCRKKAKLRRSHVYPKSILKKIARDLMEGQDHKVFTNITVKVVKRSAGGMTYGMLCAQCEQCLSQNGEEQFAKHIHNRICVDREMVQSQLKLKYGSWLYDFCIGIIFRGMAICDQFIRFGTDQIIYKLFTDCRKHLLSLPTKFPVQNSDNEPTAVAPMESPSSPFLPPSSPLPISFLVNPTVDVPPDDSKLGYLTDVMLTPGISFILVDLDTGEFLHDKPPSSILAHFDRMNILVQLQPSSAPSSLQYKIEPCGGELVVPEEYERWQYIPTGVWKAFFSLVESSENFDKAKRSHESTHAQSSTSSPKTDGTMPANFIYSFDSSFHQKDSTVVSLLPDCYALVPDEDSDSCEITIQFPRSHEVMMCTCREWGHEQRLTYFVVEDGNRPYIVFVLSLPGLHVVDGIFLDIHSCTVILPFLDKNSKKNHPLKPSVIQSLLKQNPEIEEYIRVRSQLS